MSMLPAIGLTKALRDTTGAVSTTLSAVNRTATIVDKSLQLAENRMDFELAKQKIIQDARLAELSTKEATKDESGNWTI